MKELKDILCRLIVKVRRIFNRKHKHSYSVDELIERCKESNEYAANCLLKHKLTYTVLCPNPACDCCGISASQLYEDALEEFFSKIY